MVLRSLVVFTVFALLPLACGGGGSGSSGGTYAAKCAIACTPPAGPCQTQDPAMCETQCTTLTEGLSAACAQCIVERSGWRGVACPASCADCCPCDFNPGGASSCQGGTGCSCSKTDEKCTGFEIGKASDSPCAVACAMK